jgi:hypothetical protein
MGKAGGCAGRSARPTQWGTTFVRRTDEEKESRQLEAKETPFSGNGKRIRTGGRVCGKGGWVRLRQRACRKEPVGRLETRPLPRAIACVGRRQIGHGARRGDDKRVLDAVKRARQKERARHRPKRPSSHRCRAHTVLGTGAGRVFHDRDVPVDISHWRDGKRRWNRLGRCSSVIAAVCRLSSAAAAIEVSVYCIGGCARGSPNLDAGCRPPLPKQSARPLQACRKKPPLPPAPAECDASGFYATSTL